MFGRPVRIQPDITPQEQVEAEAQRIIENDPHLLAGQVLQREAEEQRRRQRHLHIIENWRDVLEEARALLGRDAGNVLPVFRPPGTAIDPHVQMELGAMGVVLNVREQLLALDRFVGGPRRPNDAQNVHERAVNATATEALKSLVGYRDKLDSLKVHNIIWGDEADVSLETREKASDVLTSILQKDALDSNSNLRETEALSMVLNKLEELVRDGKCSRASVYTTLVTQLSEAFEFGVTVCAKGRFQHILSITQGLDENVAPIMNDEMVKEIFLTEANGILHKATRDPEANRLYSADDPVFMDRLRGTMERELARRFVGDNNIMTEHRFGQLLSEVLSAV